MKEREFTFSAKFFLPSPSSDLKVPIILSVAVENNHQFARPNFLLISNNSLPDKELHVPLQRVLVEMSINEELFCVTEASVRKGRNHFHLSLTTEIKYSWARFKSHTSQESN